MFILIAVLIFLYVVLSFASLVVGLKLRAGWKANDQLATSVVGSGGAAAAPPTRTDIPSPRWHPTQQQQQQQQGPPAPSGQYAPMQQPMWQQPSWQQPPAPWQQNTGYQAPATPSQAPPPHAHGMVPYLSPGPGMPLQPWNPAAAPGNGESALVMHPAYSKPEPQGNSVQMGPGGMPVVAGGWT